MLLIGDMRQVNIADWEGQLSLVRRPLPAVASFSGHKNLKLAFFSAFFDHTLKVIPPF